MRQKGMSIILAVMLLAWGCSGQSITDVPYSCVASVVEQGKIMLVVWGKTTIDFRSVPGAKIEVAWSTISTGTLTIALADGRKVSWQVSSNYYKVDKVSASIAIREAGGVNLWRRKLTELAVDIARQYAKKFPEGMLPADFTPSKSANEIKAFKQLGIYPDIDLFEIKAENLDITMN